RDCKVIDFYHLIVDDKKYYLRDQNLTPEGAKCIQNAILIPVDE
ncbi:branched-chain amino acid ABC transporter substrate-binding protein, partial [Clostridium perfringens]